MLWFAGSSRSCSVSLAVRLRAGSGAVANGASRPRARSVTGWTVSTLRGFMTPNARRGRRSSRCRVRDGLLREVSRRLVAEGVQEAGAGSVTIDLDATIIASGKRECLYTYRAAERVVRGERGYQPLIAFCPELGMVPWLEMRDGNVPAKLDNRRGLEEALLQLPDDIGRVVLRSDAAAYQEEVIRACNDPAFRREETRRFGTVGLAYLAKPAIRHIGNGRHVPDVAKPRAFPDRFVRYTCGTVADEHCPTPWAERPAGGVGAAFFS